MTAPLPLLPQFAAPRRNAPCGPRCKLLRHRGEGCIRATSPCASRSATWRQLLLHPRQSGSPATRQESRRPGPPLPPTAHTLPEPSPPAAPTARPSLRTVNTRTALPGPPLARAGRTAQRTAAAWRRSHVRRSNVDQGRSGRAVSCMSHGPAPCAGRPAGMHPAPAPLPCCAPDTNCRQAGSDLPHEHSAHSTARLARAWKSHEAPSVHGRVTH